MTRALPASPTRDIGVEFLPFLMLLSAQAKVSYFNHPPKTHIENDRSSWFQEEAVARVSSRSGWLSDCTVRYLTSAHPALVGDTGIGDCRATGAGLVTLRDPGDAVPAIKGITSEYEHHRCTTRKPADEWFAAEQVLASFLASFRDVGLS